MKPSKGKPGMRVMEVLAGWKSILTGSTPMLSIEITRECPLHCPGCYAYGENHLGGSATLRSLADYRGDELVSRILELVRHHRPVHLSLVGGEPLIRHRELSHLLPQLRDMGINTMVVTSAVIPVPREWMKIPNLRVAVSIDGLPEHHDVRRKPATYERILRNIAGCRVNIHWTITAPMMQREGYLEEYLRFWQAREEVARIWVSLYTPQKDEHSPEMLSLKQRHAVAETLNSIRGRYPKLLMSSGIAEAIKFPPRAPSECVFARMSTNYSADLKTRVEPCIFGGTPDCSQCGCVVSSGLHCLKQIKLAGMFRIEKLVSGSIAIGTLAGKLRRDYRKHPRWAVAQSSRDLVQIEGEAGR